MYCKQAVMAMKVLLHSKHCNKYGNASIIAWQVLLRCNKAGSDCDVFLFHTKYYTKLIYLYDSHSIRSRAERISLVKGCLQRTMLRFC
mgnify:CR=1 FL=1